MKLKTMIVEDEPLARRALRELIDEVDWLELCGEAADGKQAVAEIERLRPDLLFLDVHMPELSGLEVLNRIDYQPAVVFTTAFDRYAVTAFELEAIDYLIKPFGRRRFHATLERVQRRLTESAAAETTAGNETTGEDQEPLRRIFARMMTRPRPVR